MMSLALCLAAPLWGGAPTGGAPVGPGPLDFDGLLGITGVDGRMPSSSLHLHLLLVPSCSNSLRLAVSSRLLSSAFKNVLRSCMARVPLSVWVCSEGIFCTLLYIVLAALIPVNVSLCVQLCQPVGVVTHGGRRMSV